MILVTGATGFLGSYIVRKLIADGRSVRILKRKNSDTTLLGDALRKVEIAEGDVNDIASLQDAVEGVQYVIHSAAVIKLDGDADGNMMKTNAEGTANMMNAMDGSSVIKVVHISSVAAFGIPLPGALFDENTHLADTKDNLGYFRSKLYAEREAWRAIAEGLPVVIVSPSTILGAGKWNMPPLNLLTQIDSGLSFYPTGGSGFIDVRDAATAVIRALDSGETGQRYVINAANLSWREMSAHIAECLGKAPPKNAVSPILGRIAIAYEGLKSMLTGKEPVVTKESMRIASLSLYARNEKSINELGISYRPLVVSVREMCEAYRQSASKGYAFYDEL